MKAILHIFMTHTCHMHVHYYVPFLKKKTCYALCSARVLMFEARIPFLPAMHIVRPVPDGLMPQSINTSLCLGIYYHT
jgi:hypothetical protein